jgi:hypothetical protein
MISAVSLAKTQTRLTRQGGLSVLKQIVLSGLLCVSLLSPACSLHPQNTPPTVNLTPLARVEHPPIAEMSGIVPSSRYPGIFWVHNDSGDEARLFAIRTDGKTVMPAWMSEFYFVDKPVTGKQPYAGLRVDQASNSDWEDIAIDGDTLYIADTGNNGNARRDLGVYVLPEPNPQAVERARVLKWLPVAYPEQTAFPPEGAWPFDCEAIFVYKHKLYFVSKHRLGSNGMPDKSANLYRLDTKHTEQVNVLKKVDSRADLGGWVTAADLSPDGKTLAVLCHYPVASVWLFTAKEGDRFLSGNARRMILTNAEQCEAVCFADRDTLLVTNEQRALFRVNVGDFATVTP